IAAGSAPTTQLFATSGDGTLDGVTLASPINLATLDSLGQMPRFTVVDGLTLNTTQNVGSASTAVWGVISFNNNPPNFTESVLGNGSFVFGGSANNSFNSTNTSLTFGSGILVHGKNGTISAKLINNGTIDADTAGGTIAMTSVWTNNGTVRAETGATFNSQ